MCVASCQKPRLVRVLEHKCCHLSEGDILLVWLRGLTLVHFLCRSWRSSRNTRLRWTLTLCARLSEQLGDVPSKSRQVSETWDFLCFSIFKNNNGLCHLVPTLHKFSLLLHWQSSDLDTSCSWAKPQLNGRTYERQLSTWQEGAALLSDLRKKNHPWWNILLYWLQRNNNRISLRTSFNSYRPGILKGEEENVQRN